MARSVHEIPVRQRALTAFFKTYPEVRRGRSESRRARGRRGGCRACVPSGSRGGESGRSRRRYVRRSTRACPAAGCSRCHGGPCPARNLGHTARSAPMSAAGSVGSPSFRTSASPRAIVLSPIWKACSKPAHGASAQHRRRWSGDVIWTTEGFERLWIATGPPPMRTTSRGSTRFTERTRCSNIRNRASASAGGGRFSRLAPRSRTGNASQCGGYRRGRSLGH
jgi:hypothetical protein